MAGRERRKEERTQYVWPEVDNSDTIIYPGAEHVGGGSFDDNYFDDDVASSFSITDQSNNNFMSSSSDDVPGRRMDVERQQEPIEATMVDPEQERRQLREEIQRELEERENTAPRAILVVADNDNDVQESDDKSEGRIRKRKRRVMMGLGVVSFVLIAAVAIVLGLLRPWEQSATYSSSNDHDGPSVNKTKPPRGPGEWVQRGEDLDGEATEDRSGFAVAMSGDASTIAVGAYRNDGVSGQDSGHVRVYTWRETSWQQVGKDLDGVAPEDRFGRSVALSRDGRIVAAGSRLHGINAGQVRVLSFEETANLWLQVGQGIDGTHSFEMSGHSVALSSDGDILAVGAIYNDDAREDAGQGRVFKLDKNVWRQMGDSLNGELMGEELGRSVSLSSDGLTVAFGAPYDFEDANVDPTGTVHVFSWNGSKWNRLGQIISGTTQDDGFGNSVSLSSNGRVIAIGAPFPMGIGSVQVHAYDGRVWVPLGSAIEGESPRSQFGRSLSLSDDGLTVAVGSYLYNGTAGVSSGSTRVFWFDGTLWKPLGDGIDGEEVDDRNGWSVSISGDGNSFVTGGRLNDGIGNNAGHAQVFDFVPFD